MRKIFPLAVFAVLALVFASPAWGQAKKGEYINLDTTPQDYVALAKLPGVSGQIVSVGPGGKSMTLRVEYQVAQPTGQPKQPNYNIKMPRPNTKGNLSQAQIMREMANIQRIKNPVQRQQRLMQLMNRIQNAKVRQQVQQMQAVQKQMQQAAKAAQNPNIKVTTYAKEFQLQVTPDARVAKKQLGLEYDEKGNIKEYTPEQLKKMQDDKLPGYQAKIDEVAPGLVVYVYLAKPDGKAKAQPEVDISDIFNDATLPPTAATNAPVVQAILILSEPGFGNLPPMGKK